MVLNRIYEELILYRNIMLRQEKEMESVLQVIPEKFQKSARNLIHYLALRSMEIRPLQSKLHENGFASLTDSETHILAQINKIIGLLEQLITSSAYKPHAMQQPVIDFSEGKSLLDHHVDGLFGTLESTGKVKVMVTMPSEAATDKKLVEDLVINGMDVARINCAHDNEGVWLQIINNIKEIKLKLHAECKIYMDLMGPKLRTVNIASPTTKKGKSKGILLKATDELLMHRNPLGEEANELKRSMGLPVFGCTLQRLFEDIKTGDKIFFDDGKFGGRIVDKAADWIKVRISRGPNEKPYLKNEKGINLPDTELNIPSLTERDIEILPFICKHADLIGYSFVRNAADISNLLTEMKKCSPSTEQLPGVILKIERKEAIENLPDLLLSGMQTSGLGVMIARGDLAVEIGFERMSEMQKEIMQICSAAHVPVIWATQVLEKLAKEGVATRSEVSDAAEAARAECVMLNKGPNIIKTVKVLNDILNRMKGHMDKKRYVMRPLSIAQHFVNSRN